MENSNLFQKYFEGIRSLDKDCFLEKNPIFFSLLHLQPLKS